jgi:ribose 5-phosphate isomerase B
MRIAIGTDHRGFLLRTKLVDLLQQAGHEVVDIGTFSPDAIDYPDIAAQVADKVSRGEVERGILVCGTGLGMCIAANKFPGVRATPCHDDITAELSRRHNDSNVLCLSADLLGERLIDRMIEIWLAAPFDGGRHQRRVQKITDLEHRVEEELREKQT